MADLIYRDALIAEYDRVHVGEPGGARKLMQDAPAVNRWIPCSAMLPEDGVKCLVCMSDKNILIAKWDGKYDKQGVWCITIPSFGTKLFRIKNVPFWMPLPEPPEVTQNE